MPGAWPRVEAPLIAAGRIAAFPCLARIPIPGSKDAMSPSGDRDPSGKTINISPCFSRRNDSRMPCIGDASWSSGIASSERMIKANGVKRYRLLRKKIHPPGRAGGNQRRIEVALVVGGEKDSAFLGDVLATGVVHAIDDRRCQSDVHPAHTPPNPHPQRTLDHRSSCGPKARVKVTCRPATIASRRLTTSSAVRPSVETLIASGCRQGADFSRRIVAVATIDVRQYLLEYGPFTLCQ